MAKSVYMASLLTIVSSASFALAVDQYSDDSEYTLYCLQPPPPPGFPYVTLGIGSYNGTVEEIALEPPISGVSVVQPEFSGTANQYFAAVGYQFSEYGFLDRLEVVVTRRESLSYDPNPVLNLVGINNSLTSTVRNFSILGKFYWDIYRWKILIPYVQVGAGVSVTSVDSNSSTQLPPFAPVTLSTTESTTSFAYDAGVGIRAAVTRRLYVDLGYEYDYLGSGLTWKVPSFSSTAAPFILESGNFHSNAYNLGITYNFR